MLTLAAVRRALRREEGFAMPVMLATIVVVTILVGVALADVQGDFRPGRHDEDRKIAYAAAEAGIADYLARLENNPSYWSKCTDPANNPALGDPGTQSFVDVPGSTSQYAIELLPTAGYSRCIVGTQDSFVNSAGEFRIRSTGRAGPGSEVKRSIVATFRPKGFLNYIYYTDYETQDPALYAYSTDGLATRSDTPSTVPDLITWGRNECATRYWPTRGDQLWYGGYYTSNAGKQRRDGTWSRFATGCGEIQFAPNDKVSGPFHTNDQIMVCNTPSFGRNPKDPIEVAGGSPGYRAAPGCSSSSKPKVNYPGSGAPIDNGVGTWTPASRRDFPPSNASLRGDAQAQYRFMAPTSITLNGATMQVKGKREDGSAVDTTMPIPEGVVYVSDDPGAGSCPGYQPLAPYTPNPGNPAAPGNPACGELFIKGTYSQNVTFAAGNDIVVTGDLQRSGDAWMLGLIPDKWARVYHPTVRGWSGNTPTCSDGAGVIKNVKIDAAILALTHSFTVDGYECGSSLGTLTIRGAIAQKYRGPVGTSGNTGFIKDYQYDQRLAQRSPPRFMNPVQPAWSVSNQTEQIPAS